MGYSYFTALPDYSGAVKSITAASPDSKYVSVRRLYENRIPSRKSVGLDGNDLVDERAKAIDHTVEGSIAR